MLYCLADRSDHGINKISHVHKTSRYRKPYRVKLALFFSFLFSFFQAGRLVTLRVPIQHSVALLWKI